MLRLRRTVTPTRFPRAFVTDEMDSRLIGCSHGDINVSIAGNLRDLVCRQIDNRSARHVGVAWLAE